MAGKKGQDNSKKAAGQARKADAAAQKAAAEDAKKAAAEAADLVFGSTLLCRFCLPVRSLALVVGLPTLHEERGLYPRSTAGSVPPCDISCLHISAPTCLQSLALSIEAPLPLFATPYTNTSLRQERRASVWLTYPMCTITGPCATAKSPSMRSPYSTGKTHTLVGWGEWRSLMATCKARTFAQMDHDIRDKVNPNIGTDHELSYREVEAAKKAEAARKKAEREALLKEEEKNTPGRTQPKNAKTAVRKTRGLDLSQLDDDGSGPLATLNASGIDNALDALSLTASSAVDKIDRHPERRFKAAYAAFEERRLAEMEKDGSGQGLRLNQKKEKIKKEFEKHPDNPFNQVTARYDASREELAQLKEQERTKIEARLGSRR
ncbi:hypothetical protein NEUTE1DRAFT_78803 [Neurospora tetrasperma FGSC 2508]|uniref:Coiled-coil domain-containing protein n=1 Tax=Neurospora tetrasperma (strain FGSC 2508 / ATCC MYA-4615 / P0657) TaxID=510951 RepID=F8MJ37_NEUT8|nr:uncharacterized protein NEUTE1DRAFT_78803 [Neurospora tetrasperma FGSC 2508]EGO59086.1 hypothetical protein NEUTE1DRAFT_78803 [Neurospora tetrasperma FGSC 2508]EGZ73190.1 DUF1014-domain-containing protein [Neurospora tetrasperma FGSC 2509]